MGFEPEKTAFDDLILEILCNQFASHLVYDSNQLSPKRSPRLAVIKLDTNLWYPLLN